MPSFKYLLPLVFILLSSTALAAKPDKTLVCHVGNQLGSMGESYHANPGCTIPAGWEGDYTCPDAGKVDLILVSKNARHIGNHAHSFLDAEGYPWADYFPDEGVGSDPDDFAEGDVVGIDQGCELAEAELSCECWAGRTPNTLVDTFNDAAGTEGLTECTAGIGFAEAFIAHPTHYIAAVHVSSEAGSCQLLTPSERKRVSRPNGGADVCLTELTAIIPLITWCQLD